VAYMRDGGLGQVATRSPISEAAMPARSHDAASATLISLLKRPIAENQTARIARRVREPRALFDRLSVDEVCLFRTGLNDRGDALARFFDCELSTVQRADLRARLERSCRLAPPDRSAIRHRTPDVPHTTVRAPSPARLVKACLATSTTAASKAGPRALASTYTEPEDPDTRPTRPRPRVLEALHVAGITAGK